MAKVGGAESVPACGMERRTRKAPSYGIRRNISSARSRSTFSLYHLQQGQGGWSVAGRGNGTTGVAHSLQPKSLMVNCRFLFLCIQIMKCYIFMCMTNIWCHQWYENCIDIIFDKVGFFIGISIKCKQIFLKSNEIHIFNSAVHVPNQKSNCS